MIPTGVARVSYAGGPVHIAHAPGVDLAKSEGRSRGDWRKSIAAKCIASQKLGSSHARLSSTTSQRLTRHEAGAGGK